MPTYTEMFWTIRNEQTTNPLQVLCTTVEPIESLRGDTFGAITEARHLGVTWEQIGEALHQRPGIVRCEDVAMRSSAFVADSGSA
ncbi:hypothetical protein GCM10009772_25010 [Pseudonocardia alni subsp. carboxydivorans]|uniref:Uncharacterized protein n=1 Tax=Pseudonocardia alni subsp. carboxydivorans TaxID=415010 RepID=A0ABU9AJS4_PSEA5